MELQHYHRAKSTHGLYSVLLLLLLLFYLSFILSFVFTSFVLYFFIPPCFIFVSSILCFIPAWYWTHLISEKRPNLVKKRRKKIRNMSMVKMQQKLLAKNPPRRKQISRETASTDSYGIVKSCMFPSFYILVFLLFPPSSFFMIILCYIYVDCFLLVIIYVCFFLYFLVCKSHESLLCLIKL